MRSFRRRSFWRFENAELHERGEGDDEGNWKDLQNQMPIASPRPHAENGIPLSAIHFADGERRTYVYAQPGSAKIQKGASVITFKVPRSGEVQR